MKALLDTHALLYIASDPASLGKEARAVIDNPESLLYASLASLWEISIKVRIGKLVLPFPVSVFWEETVRRAHLVELPIEKNAILRTQELDLAHRDPFNRILSAQCLCDGLHFLSSDSQVDIWEVKRLW